MKSRIFAILSLLLALGQDLLLGPAPAFAAATLLPNGENCFQATTGLNGMVGLLGTITGGSGGTAGTYGGIALTGGSGTGATANITVSGGIVTAVAILNPGLNYQVGDVLSAASGSIGNVTGFSVPVASISINSSLAGGTVSMYQPNTNIFKQTWFNSDQAINHQNANPIHLDQNGCAIIYGTGSYRQVVQDSLGNTVWDQLTTDTSANNNVFWAGLAGGTPNVITVTDAGFNGTDGSTIVFLPSANNTGTVTLNPSSFGAIPVQKESSSGPIPLAAGDLVMGFAAQVVYLASTNSFQLLNPAPASGSATASVSPPQGRLTLTSGTPVISADVSAATTVYYTPYVGNQIGIYNGSIFATFSFPELTLSLTSSHLASTIYDLCVFSNNGVPTLVTGPAWSNSAAGAGARGTGAGTPQLQRINGFWVNAQQISAINGASSYTIAANLCTYVGSIFIDSNAGQVTSTVSYGQSRKLGLWNYYNRVPVLLQAGDPNASWTYGSNTVRASNNAAGNSLTVFSGFPEETYNLQFSQRISSGTVTTGLQTEIRIGICYNVTNAFSGTQGELLLTQNGATNVQVQTSPFAQYPAVPSLGINTVTACELAVGGTGGMSGTESFMKLLATWRG